MKNAIFADVKQIILKICYQILAPTADKKNGPGFEQMHWRLSNKHTFLMSPLLLIYF